MSLDGGTRRDALKLLGTGAGVTAFGTGTVAANGPGGGPVMEFKRMTGNDLTGSDGAIRGVDAGGLPWVVDDAEAKLDGDGALTVEVEGLVLADVESVPENLRETNPGPEFRAIVSCLTPDGSAHLTENRRTVTFPASEDGDSEIEDDLDLPETCLAPVVLVAGPAEILGSDVWFAVTSA